MWVIISFDVLNQRESVIDIVDTFPNLVHYFSVLETMYSSFKLVGPIPSASTEGKLIPVATTSTDDYYILRKTPTNTPLKKN